MKSRFSKNRLALLSIVAASLVVAAAPAHADTLWSRATSFTSGLASVKPLLVYVFLLAGLLSFGLAGWEIKKLKDERSDAKWGNVGYLMGGGAIMSGLMAWAALTQETVTGTATNMSMLLVQQITQFV